MREFGYVEGEPDIAYVCDKAQFTVARLERLSVADVSDATTALTTEEWQYLINVLHLALVGEVGAPVREKARTWTAEMLAASGVAERIELAEGGFVDAWRCVCGNTSHLEGFYPCDEEGRELEPIKGGAWDGVRYVCDRCGRIIDQDTGLVIGKRVELRATQKGGTVLGSIDAPPTNYTYDGGYTTAFTVVHINFVDGARDVAVTLSEAEARGEVLRYVRDHGGDEEGTDVPTGCRCTRDHEADVVVSFAEGECIVELTAHLVPWPAASTRALAPAERGKGGELG